MGASIKICYVMLCYVMLCASYFDLHMPISVRPARAHLILPAHAHLIFAYTCTPHLDLRMRISFTLDHAHFILICACAAFFVLRMRTSF